MTKKELMIDGEIVGKGSNEYYIAADQSFVGVDFSNVDLRNAHFSRCSFTSCKFRVVGYALWEDSSFKNCITVEAHLMVGLNVGFELARLYYDLERREDPARQT